MASQPTSQAFDLTTAAHTQTPADLTQREVEILHAILDTATFDGAVELADQIRMLHLAPGSDTTCRLYLIHPDAPRSRFSASERTRLPGRYQVRWFDGGLIGEFVVMVENGHLRALQYVQLTEREPLMLPPAEWLHIVNDDGESVSAPQRADASSTGEGQSPAPAEPVLRRKVVPARLIAFAVCALVMMSAAFALGHSNGVDLTSAQRDGAAAGRAQGTADGTTFGAFRGSTEGWLAGRAETFQSTFEATKARVRAKAKQRRIAEAKVAAVAAAAAAAAPPPCRSTYYDRYRGYNVCVH
ncbi:MAG: hypothetical protein JWN41_1570 [Thermoleophilia bacterium]|nr:hypothetical protein [Thermoleophilia bacterium]